MQSTFGRRPAAALVAFMPVLLVISHTAAAQTAREVDFQQLGNAIQRITQSRFVFERAEKEAVREKAEFEAYQRGHPERTQAAKDASERAEANKLEKEAQVCEAAVNGFMALQHQVTAYREERAGNVRALADYVSKLKSALPDLDENEEGEYFKSVEELDAMVVELQAGDFDDVEAKILDLKKGWAKLHDQVVRRARTGAGRMMGNTIAVRDQTFRKQFLDALEQRLGPPVLAPGKNHANTADDGGPVTQNRRGNN